MEEPHPKNKSKINKKLKIIICILATLFFLIISILVLHNMGYIRFPWEQSPTIERGIFPDIGGDVDNGPLSKMTKEEIMAQMQVEADASEFSFKINATPTFNDSESEGNLLIENPNHNIYPISVEIILSDSKEVIYDSGGILPNNHIDTAVLSKELKKGVYNAQAYINAYDPETKEYQGKSIVDLQITILN